MSAISVTAANVVTVAGQTQDGIAGGTLTAGMSLYLDAATNTVKAADANLSSAAATTVGVALHGASAGQPIRYQISGTINLGATLVAGTIYVVGATTAGDINPASDLTTGWRTSILGVATTTAILKMAINNSDALH